MSVYESYVDTMRGFAHFGDYPKTIVCIGACRITPLCSCQIPWTTSRYQVTDLDLLLYSAFFKACNAHPNPLPLPIHTPTRTRCMPNFLLHTCCLSLEATLPAPPFTSHRRSRRTQRFAITRSQELTCCLRCPLSRSK